MFYENLKKYRKEKGYSQSQLAEKLFVTRQCVSKWEKGATQPDLQTLAEICRILEVSADQLLGESGKKPTDAQPLNKKLFVINLFTAGFIAVFVLLLLRFLPYTVPAHMTGGKIDRYGSKFETLFHLITVTIFLCVDLAAYFVLRKFNDKLTAGFTHGVILLLQIANAIFITVFYAASLTTLPSFITCVSANFMLWLCTAMHPKFNKRNAVFGVRCSATLKSDFVWNKANAFAAYILCPLSVVIIAINAAFAFNLAYLCLITYPLAFAAVLIYCKVIELKEKNKEDEQNANNDVD